jgi:hypothetical protein
MSYPYLIQGSNIVVVIDNKSHTVTKSHMAYEKIKEAIRVGDWETVRGIVDPVKTVLNYGAGHVSVQGEKVFWKGQLMNNGLTRRMLQMYEEGFPIEPLVRFMENLMQNPSFRAVNELYGFLEKNNLPITPDGHFLAYKKVRDDYLDVHSGTTPNRLADTWTVEELASMPITAGAKNEVQISVVDGVTVVEMPRNAVNDDQNNTCSEGLHFCSEYYLSHFGGARTVILKINPADVVSIPTDYNNSKGRTCRYAVVGELGVSAGDAFTQAVQAGANTAADTLADNV